jgi:4-hydroxybenzoate polyprenyltransferase
VRPRWRAYAALTRLDKPVGWLLLLWPTLWALWLAGDGAPSGWNLVVFALGVILTRSAGCAINDWADRRIDGAVARTRGRPLATGEIQPKEALLVASGLALLALLLVLTTNALTIGLAVVAAAIAALYPFTKRFFPAPQMVLGLAFGMGIPMAYAAERGTIPPEAWLLYIANWFWCIAYDTLYAMVDRDDDLKLGVRSTAILFGDLERLAIALLHAAFWLSLFLLGRKLEFGLVWPITLAVAAVLIAHQLWLIRARDPAQAFRAFQLNNVLGLMVTIGLFAAYP